MTKIAIIDYGMGNLRSVENMCKRYERNTNIVSNPNKLKNYKKIILPGVGSFKKAMSMLTQKDWIETIKKNVIKEKKIFSEYVLECSYLPLKVKNLALQKV